MTNSILLPHGERLLLPDMILPAQCREDYLPKMLNF